MTLPEDPAGWGIIRTDDGGWQPVSRDGGTRLDVYPTKDEAVAAAEAHRTA